MAILMKSPQTTKVLFDPKLKLEIVNYIRRFELSVY